MVVSLARVSLLVFAVGVVVVGVGLVGEEARCFVKGTYVGYSSLLRGWQ